LWWCSHTDGSRCKYSDVPDTSNQCKCAHSQEELDEWNERWEWRQMKRDMAKSQHVYSYMKQLREEYEKTSSGNNIVRFGLVDGMLFLSVLLQFSTQVDLNVQFR
jgi:hypothetical protein